LSANRVSDKSGAEQNPAAKRPASKVTWADLERAEWRYACPSILIGPPINLGSALTDQSLFFF
jgi:hypothetical protein